MDKSQMQQIMDDIYNFICLYIQENGYSPSQNEIAIACYLGRTTLLRYLDRLEASGRIARNIGHARSVRIIDGKCLAPSIAVSEIE